MLKKIKAVKDAVNTLSADEIEQHSRTLDITLEEYIVYQNQKSLACAMNLLSLEDSQAIYNYLGSGPDDFNKQPFPVKFVVAKTMVGILKAMNST